MKRFPAPPRTKEEKNMSRALIEMGATPAEQIIFYAIMKRHKDGKYTSTTDIANDVGYSRRWAWEVMREMCKKKLLTKHPSDMDYYIPENLNTLGKV